MRKIQDQNSAESGYSDEHPSDADADEEEAGTSQKFLKVKRFDENLLMFDRTASPTSSERRKSESPLIHDFPSLCGFSRAQSEPPGIASPDVDSAGTPDSEVFEVLDLIPDPVQDRCAVTVSEEFCEAVIAREQLVVTPPPQIHVHDPPRLKAHLRKHKKDKIKKSNATETAEDMFNRLMGLTKDECSTCTCSTSIDEDEGDEVHENIEEIQEIPLDDEVSVASSEVEHCVPCTSSSIEIEKPPTPEKAVEADPQPSTSRSDESALTAKEQEYLQRREARLARLEAEAQAFYDRMAKNKDKGQQLDNHLNDIHQTFLDRNKDRKDEKVTDEPSTSDKDDKSEGEGK